MKRRKKSKINKNKNKNRHFIHHVYVKYNVKTYIVEIIVFIRLIQKNMLAQCDDEDQEKEGRKRHN
jgi:hypothetical protein